MRLPKEPEKLKLLSREYIIKHCRSLEATIEAFEKELDSASLLEKLAALEHKQWAHWIKYQQSQKELAWLDFFKKTGAPQFDSNNMERWILQSQTPYPKLTEKEKDSDREWAREVLKLIGERVW